MNQREKMLAAAVGALLVLIVGFFGFSTMSDMLKQRKQRVESLEKQVHDKERDVMMGRRAASQMQQYAARSLPSDREVARSQYQAWLLELVDRVGVRESSVKSQPGRPHGDVYYQHVFSLNGKLDLKQLTGLLYDFYSLDLLHRIKSLRISQIPESSLLDLAMQIEVLSLTDAPAKGDLPGSSSNRLAHTEQEYADAILNRNLFGPANNPPRLSSVGNKQVDRGGRLSIDVSARDADEKQKLRYTLFGTPPSGMRIDANSGKLEWSPRDLGKYEVTVQVTDDGLPAKRDEETFTVTVVEPPPPRPLEPPPPKPTFNLAQFSVITAITEKAGRKQVWINVRPEGRMLKLHEGDDIAVGQLNGVIREINAGKIVIETDEDLLVVALGNALTDADRLP